MEESEEDMKAEKKNKKSFWEGVYDLRMESVQLIKNPKKGMKKMYKKYKKIFK